MVTSSVEITKVSATQAPPEVVTQEIQAPEADNTTAPHVSRTVVYPPNQCSHSTEDHSSEVSHSIRANSRQYVLPNRYTRGQPTKRYEPTI